MGGDDAQRSQRAPGGRPLSRAARGPRVSASLCLPPHWATWPRCRPERLTGPAPARSGRTSAPRAVVDSRLGQAAEGRGEVPGGGEVRPGPAASPAGLVKGAGETGGDQVLELGGVGAAGGRGSLGGGLGEGGGEHWGPPVVGAGGTRRSLTTAVGGPKDRRGFRAGPSRCDRSPDRWPSSRPLRRSHRDGSARVHRRLAPHGRGDLRAVHWSWPPEAPAQPPTRDRRTRPGHLDRNPCSGRAHHSPVPRGPATAHPTRPPDPTSRPPRGDPRPARGPPGPPAPGTGPASVRCAADLPQRPVPAAGCSVERRRSRDQQRCRDEHNPGEGEVHEGEPVISGDAAGAAGGEHQRRHDRGEPDRQEHPQARRKATAPGQSQCEPIAAAATRAACTMSWSSSMVTAPAPSACGRRQRHRHRRVMLRPACLSPRWRRPGPARPPRSPSR